MKRIVCLTMLIFSLLPICICEATETDNEYFEAIGMKDVYSAIPHDAHEFEKIGEFTLDEGLNIVFKKLISGIKDLFAEGMKCVITIVAIAILCECVCAISQPKDGETVKNAVSLIGAIAVTGVASRRIIGVVSMGRNFIDEVDSFSKVFLPVVAAAEAACGAPGAALSKSTAAVFFSDVLITLVNRFLIPLVYVNVFAATANAASKSEALRRICDLSTKVVAAVLRFLLGSFLSYITVAGLVAAGADNAGIKTAQFAAANIPVVGNIMSEATQTVAAGARMIKNTIGVFGMLVILSACVTPFVTLGFNYFLFKLASVCAAPVIGGNISELTDRIGQTFGLILAMVATCATVLFLAVIAAMKSVGVV